MKLIEYRPEYKEAIMRISLEWLEKYSLVEDIDIDMLSHPERITDAGGHIVLAVDDTGEAMGTVMLAEHGDSYELLKYGVLERFRHRGAGRALLDECIRIARQDGKKRIILDSNHQLTDAIRMYERAGFRHAEFEPNMYALSDLSMVLELE